MQIQIFIISGKLIKTINELIQTTKLLARPIIWNGLGGFWEKKGKGVYIYRSKVTLESDNLLIEKYEKLVIF